MQSQGKRADAWPQTYFLRSSCKTWGPFVNQAGYNSIANLVAASEISSYSGSPNSVAPAISCFGDAPCWPIFVHFRLTGCWAKSAAPVVIRVGFHQDYLDDVSSTRIGPIGRTDAVNTCVLGAQKSLPCRLQLILALAYHTAVVSLRYNGRNTADKPC